MYARLITFSGADADKRENAIQTIRETVIPMLRQYEGYGGYISLYDEAKGQAKAIVLWDSKETADANEARTRRAPQATDRGHRPDDRVDRAVRGAVVELEGARV